MLRLSHIAKTLSIPSGKSIRLFSTINNMALTHTDEIKLSITDNGVAFLTLNRPSAFNALSEEMVNAINNNLPILEKNDSINCVIVTGEGPKAFCAGGDIRKISEGTPEENATFFDLEYEMDHRTHTFSKPYVSLWNGFVMGGGLGVSVHGRYRVATDNVVVAMPETGIGLFPDVGGSFFLPKLRGAVGLYIGISGARLNAADCMKLGLATHFISTASIPDFLEEVKKSNFIKDNQHENMNALLNKFSGQPKMLPSISEADFEAIETLMGDCTTFQEFVTRLNNAKSLYTGHTQEFAVKLLTLLRTKCPLSCGVWFDLYKMSKRDNFSLFDSLSVELKLAQYFTGFNPNNFKEGVRVTLINKGDKPMYSPVSIEEVTQSVIDEVFKKAAEQERTFQRII